MSSDSSRFPGILALASAALLSGAGADARAQVAPETELPAVVVEDARLRASSSIADLSSEPAERTPLAISTVSAGEISDRGIESLSALVRDLPSVRDSYNTFGYIEALQVRGFALDERLNTMRDGMSVNAHVPVAFENKEQVQILKGVSGMLAGASAPGGMVNFVLKQPTETDFAQADAMLSERGSLRLHVDLGGHAGESHALGYRINAALEDRRPEIDRAWSKRALASAFFDWHAGAGTLVQAEFELQRLRAISVPGYGLVDAGQVGTGTLVGPAIDPHINLNSQSWTQPFESTVAAGSLRLQQALSAGWELSVRAGLQRSRTNDRIAFPDGCTPANPAAPYVYNGMCAGNFVDIWQYISDGERRDSLDVDAHVHGRWHVLGTLHEVTAGLRDVHQVERYPDLQTYAYAGTESVDAPFALPSQPAPTNPNAPFDLHQQEAYGYDLVPLGARAKAWLGLRASRIGQHSMLTDGSQATQLSQDIVTPWLGAGWTFRNGGYAWMTAGSGVEVTSVPNHSVAVRTTGGPLVLANAGQALPVQRSHQMELGLRTDPGAPARLEATLFRIDKPFADNIAMPGGTAVQVAGARRQRNQGLELQADWNATGELLLRAAATWLDARTTSAPDPATVGRRAVNTAGLAGIVDADWTPAGTGFTWSNRANFTTPVAALPDQSAFLPASWQWDSFARWTSVRGHGHRTVRLGIDNVTDRRYWREAPMAPWGSIYLFPAPARTMRISFEITS